MNHGKVFVTISATCSSCGTWLKSVRVEALTIERALKLIPKDYQCAACIRAHKALRPSGEKP